MATPNAYRPLLDHHHDAGIDWFVDIETEMSELEMKRTTVSVGGDSASGSSP
jgi:hypothetical protein